MVPNKELQELAAALKRTAEYEQMVAKRKEIVGKYRQMMTNFEREHTQLYHQKLPEMEMIARLKALYAKYKDFLEQDDVRVFLQAARAYQKLVSECVSYLNRLLESEGAGRMF